LGWLAFGSHGRREETLSADQDTGLCYPDRLDEKARAWFARLGRWVTDALERCGYPRCPGGVMASEDRWRRSVSGWRDEFRAWIDGPSGEHLLGAEIGFDLRTVTGGLDADTLLGATIATAADSQVFLARLGREAVSHRPPLGFRGRIAVDRSGPNAGTFDVKAGAMLPIADLARLHRLAQRGREVGTFARLEAAAADGSLSPDLAAILREGYGLGLRLRLDRHLQCLRDGLPLDNRVDPGQLPPLVRSTLKETFRAIRSAQSVIESVYMTGRLA
jgi:CBS domain-containing protein